jgi:hypothetical protein
MGTKGDVCLIERGAQPIQHHYAQRGTNLNESTGDQRPEAGDQSRRPRPPQWLRPASRDVKSQVAAGNPGDSARARTEQDGSWGTFWELGTWNLEGPPPAQIISFGEAAPSSSSPALNRHREGPERTNLRHSSHDLNETPRILKILPCHSCQLCGNEPHPTPILDRTVGASPGPKRFTQ